MSSGSARLYPATRGAPSSVGYDKTTPSSVSGVHRAAPGSWWSRLEGLAQAVPPSWLQANLDSAVANSAATGTGTESGAGIAGHTGANAETWDRGGVDESDLAALSGCVVAFSTSRAGCPRCGCNAKVHPATFANLEDERQHDCTALSR